MSGCCPLLSPPGTVPLRGPSGVRLRGSGATERSGSPLWLNIISGTADARRPDANELPPVFYWPRPSEATVPLLAVVGSWAASEGPGQGSLMVMWQPLGPARARQLTLAARRRSVEANTYRNGNNKQRAPHQGPWKNHRKVPCLPGSSSVLLVPSWFHWWSKQGIKNKVPPKPSVVSLVYSGLFKVCVLLWIRMRKIRWMFVSWRFQQEPDSLPTTWTDLNTETF